MIMKQNMQVWHDHNELWSKCLDWNPQLFRELKGKLKTRNVVVAAAISVITQFVIVISLLSELPDPDPKGLLEYQTGRYAFGYGTNDLLYTKDMMDNWMIDWQLLWLDLFMILSIISIFALSIVGTYMLIADTVKEESRGTLNFIRLTPQSSGSILLGKILGVPILLYTVILLLVPLHLIAGLEARIPLTLIIGFDAVIVASCAFCYSLALVWSLMNCGLSGFKPWLASGTVGFILSTTTMALVHNGSLSHAIFDWLFLFNPAIVLSYLIDATCISQNKIDFLSAENLGELLFYGQALWTKASIGIGLMLCNLSLWTYWCWSVLKRRFYNPENTLVSKTQSYWLTGWLMAIALGFTLQQGNNGLLTSNFVILQCCLFIWGLALIALLSPHRQALYDWARYRHQKSENGNILWKELIFGENSPSTMAMAINLAIAIAYITPSIFLMLGEDKQQIFWGFILNVGCILLCAVVAQLILTVKTRKRAVWSAITVFSMIVLPPLYLDIAGIAPETSPQAWLFSFMPTIGAEYATFSTMMLAVSVQWFVISLIGLQMTRKLRQAGASETKMLFSQSH